GVSACFSAEELPPRALDCAAFCRATSDCSGDRAALSPCLTRCLAHFPEATDERGAVRDMGHAVDQGAPLDQRPDADRGEEVAADQGREAGSLGERQRFEAARACLSVLGAEERERCDALTNCL
ncbi:MAG: hypothetical protein VYD19_05000, partial [Myxococcota bacterium]|nr:hypothetical protein [Myxococcota bacterium]